MQGGQSVLVQHELIPGTWTATESLGVVVLMVEARVEQLVVCCLVGLGEEVFYYQAVIVMIMFDSSVMVVVQCMDMWGHVHDWRLVGDDVCWKHICKSHDILI